MAAGVADVFEIVMFAAGADAFLRGSGAGVIACFEALKDLLELVHAGVGEEQRRVVGGQQGTAADDAMPAGMEEVEKTLTDIVAGHNGPLNGWIVRLYEVGRRGAQALGSKRMYTALVGRQWLKILVHPLIRTALALNVALTLAAADNGRTSLIDAAKNGDKVALRALLQKKADVNAVDADGSTALHWASYRDDIATADLLIRAGAKVNVANESGRDAAFRPASQNGSAGMVWVLLTAGADPNAALLSGKHR